MPASLITADCGASAAVSGLVALVGELIDAKAIDGAAADRVQEAMLRAVDKFEVAPHDKAPVRAAIETAFAWSLADGKGGKKG